MTGKFKDYNNFLVVFVCALLLPLFLYFGMEFCVSSGISMDLVYVVIILAIVVPIALLILFGQGSFTAYKKKVVFWVGFIKHTYSYSEIESAETQTGFIHGRYGASPHVELTIKLKNGDTVIFRDSTVPDDALSTPEKHKEFHENHQFTKLSDYINQRVKR